MMQLQAGLRRDSHSRCRLAVGELRSRAGEDEPLAEAPGSARGPDRNPRGQMTAHFSEEAHPGNAVALERERPANRFISVCQVF